MNAIKLLTLSAVCGPLLTGVAGGCTIPSSSTSIMHSRYVAKFRLCARTMQSFFSISCTGSVAACDQSLSVEPVTKYERYDWFHTGRLIPSHAADDLFGGHIDSRVQYWLHA